MKLYQHIIFIAVLVLSTVLFYKNGLGFVPFFLAAIYFGTIFTKEMKRRE